MQKLDVGASVPLVLQGKGPNAFTSPEYAQLLLLLLFLLHTLGGGWRRFLCFFDKH